MQQQQQQQTQIITTRGTENDRQRARKFMRRLRHLGLAQCWLSVFCFLLGSIAISMHGYTDTRIKEEYKYTHTSYSSSSYYYIIVSSQAVTIGEGLWGSIVPFIAGCLAMAAGGKESSSKKLKAHLGLGIISSISSAAIFATSIIMNLMSNIYYHYETYEDEDRDELKGIKRLLVGFRIILGMVATISFINMILFVVSSSYTCRLMPSCSCYVIQQPQMMIMSGGTMGAGGTGGHHPTMYIAPPNGQVFSTPSAPMQFQQAGQTMTLTRPSFVPQQPMTSQPQQQQFGVMTSQQPPMYSPPLPAKQT